MDHRKAAAMALIVILVVNMTLFAFGMVGQLPFWLILAVIAIIAWKAFPMVKPRD